MGVLLFWDEKPTDSEFDNTEIHRADSEGGSYSLIKTITDITDVTYYDEDGDTTKWYKIRFKNVATSTFSAFSSEMQGNAAHLYTNPDDVLEAIGLDKTSLPAQLTLNTIYNYVWDASRNIDELMKTVYGRTETFTHMQSSQYLNVGNIILLPYKNVSDIVVSFKDSIESETFTTINDAFDYEVMSEPGRIKLYRRALLSPRVYEDIKVTGSYGDSTIPDKIKQYTKILAGIRAIVHITGGSFDDITAYTIGEYQVSLGEPFTNLRETMKMLEAEKKTLLEMTGMAKRQSGVRMH